MPDSLKLFDRPAASLQGRLLSCCWAVLCALAVWGMGSGPPAFAQAATTCEPLLAAAEERYMARAFAEAEELVRACLAHPERGDDEALRAYRLLALVFLRQDDLSEAKQAVIRLLGVSFDYVPDPVQDPPVYVALVTSVKDQLRVDREQPPIPDVARAVLPPLQPELREPDTEPDMRVVRTDREPQEEPAPTAERAPAESRSGIGRWLVIGGGAIAAGVVGVLLSGGSSPDPHGGTPLPPPPSFPR